MELGGEWLYETRLTGPAPEAAYARVLSQQKLNMEQQFIQQGNAMRRSAPVPTIMWRTRPASGAAA